MRPLRGQITIYKTLYRRDRRWWKADWGTKLRECEGFKRTVCLALWPSAQPFTKKKSFWCPWLYPHYRFTAPYPGFGAVPGHRLYSRRCFSAAVAVTVWLEERERSRIGGEWSDPIPYRW